MKIPITFNYQNKEYKGELSPVSGSGSNATYHLTVDGFHWGQLSYITGSPGFNGKHAVAEGWRFSSNTQDLQHLAEDFGRVVEAAYQ